MQVMDNLGSVLFMISYLAIIWIFLIKITVENLRKGTFMTHDGSWKWTFLAYFLLGFGDLFHLGFRIYIFFGGFGPDDHVTNLLISSGYIISGITMTYFYISIFHSWKALYGENYSTPAKSKKLLILLYSTFIIRLILVALPYNRWYEGDASLDFGFDFRMISAIPIYIIGITSVFFLFKDSKAEMKKSTGINSDRNRGNYHASIWYVVSYICYSITLFLVAIIPLTGLFMIPKTIAYLIAFFYHYKTMLNQKND